MRVVSSVSLCFVSLSVFYSKSEVATVETELLRDYRFGQQQLIEIWGHACAIAVTKVCLTREHELHYSVNQNSKSNLVFYIHEHHCNLPNSLHLPLPASVCICRTSIPVKETRPCCIWWWKQREIFDLAVSAEGLTASAALRGFLMKRG